MSVHQELSCGICCETMPIDLIASHLLAHFPMPHDIPGDLTGASDLTALETITMDSINNNTVDDISSDVQSAFTTLHRPISNEHGIFKQPVGVPRTRLLACALCGEFVQKSALKLTQHAALHALDETLACTQCRFVAKSATQLKEHCLRRHACSQQQQQRGEVENEVAEVSTATTVISGVDEGVAEKYLEMCFPSKNMDLPMKKPQTAGEEELEMIPKKLARFMYKQ